MFLFLIFLCVSYRCNGKSVCELNINDVRSSDPCPGIHKYLETNYTCFPASQLNDNLFKHLLNLFKKANSVGCDQFKHCVVK